MESCFPCPAGLPFRPVRSGGRLYRIESARTFRIFFGDGYQRFFHIPAVTEQNDIFLFLAFRHYLTDHVSCQFKFWFLLCPHTITERNRKPGNFILFPDRYAEHQDNKTVSVLVGRTPVSSMIKQDGNIFKLCPRFGTIVSSMQRNTGYVRRKSGTSRKAMDAVIFMNRE